MKTKTILTLGIFSVIGAYVIYYFKKNKLQIIDNVKIEDKIQEAVKQIASTTKATEEARLSKIDEELKIKTETDNKEASDYLAKTLLIDKLNKLRKVQRASFFKTTPQQRKELLDTIGDAKTPILTQIREVENTLKDKYGINPDSQGEYNI